jgi:hypothetical protein
MDSNFRFRVPCKGRKAIIAGFGCMPPSVDYLRLPSVDITQGGLSEISEPKPYRARNRKFESISLQRRVRCEPDFLSLAPPRRLRLHLHLQLQPRSRGEKRLPTTRRMRA